MSLRRPYYKEEGNKPGKVKFTQKISTEGNPRMGDNISCNMYILFKPNSNA